MNRNETVLSYNDCLLRQSDLDLLRTRSWLNDTIISFYFEYLESEIFQDKKSLLFVSPEVTQCIKITQAKEIGVFLNPLLEEFPREFIFFALNDNKRTESSGGSHWSLLVFSRPENMVFHYDSSKGMNNYQAMGLAEKLLHFFNVPYRGRFQEVNCLQQTNGYDCGVHVLCNTQQLASYATRYGRIEGCPRIHPHIVHEKRYEILTIIENLKRSR